MKTNAKRTLALLLFVLMLIGMLPTAAFAAEGEEPDEIITEQVEPVDETAEDETTSGQVDLDNINIDADADADADANADADADADSDADADANADADADADADTDADTDADVDTNADADSGDDGANLVLKTDLLDLEQLELGDGLVNGVKDVDGDVSDGEPTRDAALSDNYILYDGEEGTSITVTFDANGGEGTMESQTIVADSTSHALYANTFTLEGSTFQGWSIHPVLEQSEIVYSSGRTIPASGDVTLYAIWSAAPSGFTDIFNSAQYGNTLVTLAGDGNGGWKITAFEVWAPGQYPGDPGSPTKIYIPATYNGMPITAIGSEVFKGAGLKGVRFASDSQITTIGSSAFEGNSLGKLTLPVTVETIGSKAFYDAGIGSGGVNFTSLVNLKSIGGSSFYRTNITSLDLSNTQVTVIPNYAFYYCSISNPILHPETTSIGNDALAMCKGTIVIPSTVTTIGTACFENAPANTTIDLSALPASVVVSVYSNCVPRYYDHIKNAKIVFPSEFYDNDTDLIIYNDTIYGVKDSWEGGTLTVPAGAATKIAKGAFAMRGVHGRLTSLVFEEGCGITKLPAQLCSINSSLTSVTFHEGLQDIDQYAFYECTGLTSLTNLPSTLKTIQKYAFMNCENLTEIVIPKSVTDIGASAFAYCYALRTVTVGDETGSALTGRPSSSFPTDVFWCDGGLTDIYVRSVLKADGISTTPWKNNPWGATGATIHWKDDDLDPTSMEVVDEDGVHWKFNSKNGYLLNFVGKKNEDGTLNKALSSSNRVSLTVPTRVYALGDTEFASPMTVSALSQYFLADKDNGDAHYFGTVTVPGSFGSIKKYVFSRSVSNMGTVSIQKCVLEEGITGIEGSAFYAISLTRIIFPSTLKSIGDSAFAYSGLSGKIELNEGLETIGKSAFGYTHIGESIYMNGELVIPSSVRSIDNTALTQCSGLSLIRIMQYRNAEGMPEGGVLAPSSWIGNNFGATSVGNNVLFLDSVTTDVELVDTIVHSDITDETDPFYQSTTVIVRARKESGVVELHEPYLTAREDEDIVNFHVIAEGSSEWHSDYDDEWVYVSLTVTKDKTYYFDGTFYNSVTGQVSVAPLPITVQNNFGTLHYDYNGGAGTMPEDVTRLVGTSVSVADIPADLARYGYMVGMENADHEYVATPVWNTEPDGSGDSYVPGSPIILPIGTVTLYPSWVPDPNVKYNVVYSTGSHGHIAEGYATSNQDLQVLSNAGVTGSKAEADEGYHVTGWVRDDGTSVVNGSTLSEANAKSKLNRYGTDAYANTEYTAAVAANTYTVKFNPNGGSGSMANQTVTYGQSTTLTANAFDIANGRFLGWDTNSAGTTVVYEDGADFGNEDLVDLGVIGTNGATINLYAVWQMSYTVNFDANGGEGSMDPQTIPYGTATALSANVFSRTGYEFTGWTLAGSTDLIEDEAVVTDLAGTNDSVTLYAQWNAIVSVAIVGSSANTTFNGTEQSNDAFTVSYTVAGVAAELPSGFTQTVSAVNDNGDEVDPVAKGTNAGTYTVTVTVTISNAPAGYVIGTDSASDDVVLVIGSAPASELGLTTTNYSDVYDGGEHSATVSVTVTDGTTVEYLVDGEWTPDAPIIKNVGSATYSVRATNSNYETATGSVTLTVTAKTASIKADDKTKTYDNDPSTDPALTATVTGAVAGETLDYELDRAPGQTVGEYDITVTAGSNPNYSVSVEGGKFTISAAGSEGLGLVASGHDDVYDGNSYSVSASVTVTDDTTIEYSLNGDDWTTDAPSIKDVDEFTVYVRATNSNYATATTTVTMKVTPKAVTVTANDNGKVYNGAEPTLDATEDGVVAGDTLVYEVVRVAGEDVGEYAINVVPGTNRNYSVTPVAGKFTITPAAASLLGLTASGCDVTYDGKAHSATVSVAVTDGTTVYYSWTRAWTTEAPSITDVGELTVQIKAENKNYETATATVTLKVTAKELTITADSDEKVFDGDPLVKDSYTYSALAEGDSIESVTVTGSRTDVGCSDNVPSAAKIVNAEGNVVTENYAISYVNGKLEVTKASADLLGLTATGYEGAYDGASHAAEATVTVTENTNIFYSTNGSDWSETAPSVKDVTEITIYVKAENKNYETANASVTLKVTQASLSITTPSAEKQYDGKPFPGGPNGPFNALIEGLADGETIGITFLGTQYVNVGEYPNDIIYQFAPESATKSRGLTIDGETPTAKAGNYIVSLSIGTLKIKGWDTPADSLTIIAASAEKVYDGTPLTSDEFTVDGLPTGYSVEVVIEGTQTKVGASDNVITDYVIKDQLGQNKNAFFTVKTVDGKLTVKTAHLTVTADSASKVYDGAALTKDSATATGLASGDKLDSVTVTGSQTEIGSSENVPSAARILNSDGEDVTACYDITYVNGTLEVKESGEDIGDTDTPLGGDDDNGDDLYGGSDTTDEPLYNPAGVPSTGDESHIFFWLAISLLSMAGIGVMLIGRKRKEDEK